jgi:hypothetical protein
LREVKLGIASCSLGENRAGQQVCVCISERMTAKKNTQFYTKSSRCWPGYEPVPGKSEHEEGSCRKKPASKNGGKEVSRETARKKQIALGGKRAQQAKAKSPRAAERRSASKRRKAA